MIVYFGATVPSVAHTGNWQSLDQWYADLGTPQDKNNPAIPATSLGRFPDAATDVVHLYQNIISGVATYNTATGLWSTNNTYSGNMTANFNNITFTESSAIYSGIITLDYAYSFINGGTFHNIYNGISGYWTFINGGTVLSVTGVNPVRISSAGLAGIQTNTFASFNSTITIILDANATSTTTIQLGSYNTPITSLTIQGAYSMANNIILYMKGNSATNICTNSNIKGLLDIRQSNQGYADFSASGTASYTPTVTIPLIVVNGQYRVNDTSVPKAVGFGLGGGTFTPTVKLSNLPVATNNIGAIVE